MIYSYLFEIKSIQAYLFKTGKLKDVISASERLDRLVDDNKTSTLYQVLKVSGLSSDLIPNEKVDEANENIHFIRNKGGAFYAYSQCKTSLLTLRSTWTLTLLQLFPNLEFVDAFSEAPLLKGAIQLGLNVLAQDRNSPQIKFPLATAITKRSQRTGGASVPISEHALKAGAQEKIHDKELDVDTELHRQAYQSLTMRTKAALQDKFTPNVLKGKLSYPIDLDTEFEFTAVNLTAKKAIKDIAIIHIDGNGLGLILRELQSSIASTNVTDSEYRKAFRTFSNALSIATQAAAQSATQWLYNVWKDTKASEKECIPMRPIVLGGDDITLLCRADLALQYSKHFCIAFKEESKKELMHLFKGHLKNSAKLKPYLTASGGVLYHKAGHPFTHSHQIVEELCAKAKGLTKKVDASVGPAALSFYRVSNTVSNNIDQHISQSQSYSLQSNSNISAEKNASDTIDANNTAQTISLGLHAYLVESEAESNEASFDDLEKCIAIANQTDQYGDSLAPMSMRKWRQMATHIAQGDETEAERIYQRANAICSDKTAAKEQLSAIKRLVKLPEQLEQFRGWYWQVDTNHKQTIISDLLTIDHFSFKKSCNTVNRKEQS